MSDELLKNWTLRQDCGGHKLYDEYTRKTKDGFVLRIAHYPNGKWGGPGPFRDDLLLALKDADAVAELRGGWAE